MELDDDNVERIAQRVAALLSDRDTAAGPPTEPVRLIDAATLADRINVRREWVYRHARQLGALRLGGPHGVLRFDLDAVLQRGVEPFESAGPEQRGASGRSGLGFPGRSTYSRTGSTKSGRAARQRPRPDNGRSDPPMQNHRSAREGGCR